MALTRAELIAAGIEIPGSSSAESFIPTGNTVPTDGLYLEDTNRIGLATNSTGRLFIDSSGNIQHGVIPRFNVKSYGNVSKIPQIQSARVGESVFSLANFDIGFEGGGAIINLSKSRSTNPSAYRWLTSGQTIGQIVFQGDDGFGFTPGAAIVSSTDAASGITAPNMVAGTSYKIYSNIGTDFTLVGASSNDVGTVFTATGPTTGGGEVVPANGTMPANIRFYTTPYGASAPSERLRITSAGLVGIGTSAPRGNLEVATSLTYGGSVDQSIYLGATNVNAAVDNGNTLAYRFLVSGDQGGQDLRIRAVTRNLGGANVEKDRITIDGGTGNVGIRNTSPNAILEVGGGSSSTPVVNLATEGTAYSSGAGTGNLLYAPSSTVLQVFNATQTAGVGQLINFSTYDSAGYSGAYFGAVGGNVINGPAHLVFGRRTGAQAWTESARIDSSGRLLVGTSSTVPIFGQQHTLQAEALSSTHNASFVRHGGIGAVNGAVISLARSRGTSSGQFTAVQNGDSLGYLLFSGANGTDFSNAAAWITAEVDGTPFSSGDTTDLPGRLVFSTTADGTSSPTERMRITSTGQVRLAGAGITFNGDTAAVNELDDYEEGVWGSTSAANRRYTKIGSLVHCNFEINIPSTGDAFNQTLPFTVRQSTAGYSAIEIGSWFVRKQSGTYEALPVSSQCFIHAQDTNVYLRNSTGSSASKTSVSELRSLLNYPSGALAIFMNLSYITDT